MLELRLIGLKEIPMIKKGDNLGQIISAALQAQEIQVKDKDIFVIASKIVSKAEGAIARLSDITPSAEAQALAARTGRDARLCQIYINESSEILRVKGRMVITRDRLGFEGSSAGVDRSNVEDYGQTVVLLPENPDKSASILRQTLKNLLNREVAVIINDSFGRHTREGSVGTAIGLAGIRHLEEHENRDLFGNPSRPSIALVDEIAAAASILMGQSDEGLPVILVSGVDYTIDEKASIKPLLVDTHDLWHLWRNGPEASVS